MNPDPTLVAELRLVLINAEADALILRAARDAGRQVPDGTLEDHRTNVLGEVLTAIESAVPGMGNRLQAAMYPFTANEEQPA